MSWEEILNNIDVLKTEFDKSYKCINKHAPPTELTLNKHIQILIENYNGIRGILNVSYKNLSSDHVKEADSIFSKLRDRLVRVFGRYNLHFHVPSTLSEELDISVDNNSSSESELTEEETDVKMVLSALDFLNFASKIIPDFDGKPENLQRFVDAIDLATSQVETHENILINLIKTKLVGTARNAISNETSVAAIIVSLKSKIKSESTDVITAKIMNVKQTNKSANQFSREIEDLTKSLENAFIKDGVSPNLAEKYSTQAAVKAFSTNSSNEKVKLVMQSGQFSSMNEAVSKFVNSSTEFSRDNNVFFYNSNRRYNNNFNRNRNQGNRYNRNNFQNRFNSNNRGRGNNHNNRGGHNQFQNGNRNFQNYNNNFQNNNVRHFNEHQPENFQAPRAFSLGEAQQQ